MLLPERTTVIKRNLFSLIAPQHPKKPIIITNTPAAIRIFDALTMVPSSPNKLSQSFDSILLHIPIPNTAIPQT